MELLIIFLVLLGLAGTAIYYYNKIVALSNSYRNALKQIDVILKQRHDMVPNLVETVKGYASHERETLNDVIEARNGAEKARQAISENGDVSSLPASENMLTQMLGKMFALSEAYPDLKANENFKQLQEDLRSIEERVAAARRGYNNTVLEYNIGIESFPGNIFAGMFSYRRAQELDFDDAPEIQEAPQVSFT